METCIVCTQKHLADAEIFTHEANAGYGHHIVKALGQMDHAEIECRKQWPELSAIIHEQKKFISDAVDLGDPTIADAAEFDGLQILCQAIEGHWALLHYNPHNGKGYDAQKWIDRGVAIRQAHGLDVPDLLFNIDNVPGQLDDLGTFPNGHHNRDGMDDATIRMMKSGNA